MRRAPTEAEKTATEALADAYRKDGHTVEFPPRKTLDKPDILIKVREALIACECTQIPPSSVYHHHVKRSHAADWEGLDLQSTIWPNEPHIWIANAIGTKVPKVPEYLSRTSAKYAWLLVHSPLGSKQSFVREDKEWVLRALRYGARMNQHPFHQVFLWTPQRGIQRIFPPVAGDLDTKFEVDFKDGYPTSIDVRFYLSFRTLDSQASEMREVRYIRKTRKSTIIKPQDPTYAKHKPATRDTSFEVVVQSWPDHVTMQCKVTHEDIQETITLPPNTIRDLAPGTTYDLHFLYEYAAPRRLHTTHR